MVIKVPWDELPGVEAIGSKPFDWQEVPEGAGLGYDAEAKPEAGKPLDFQREIKNTMRRVAFGAVIGSISGIAFGSVDVVKDVKGMLAKRAAAAKTVMTYGYRFGTFNGVYQGLQYTLSRHSGLDPEICIGAAAAASMAPLVFTTTLRGMLPYATALVVIDCINASTEGRAFTVKK